MSRDVCVCGEIEDRDYLMYCKTEGCYYYICADCYNEQHGEEIDKYDICDRYNELKPTSCGYCLTGDVEDSKLVGHALKLLSITRKELIELYKVEKNLVKGDEG